MTSLRLHGMEWYLHAPTGDVIPISVSLEWKPRDPLELLLTFPSGGPEPVRWVIARDLVTDAVRDGHAGEGDVRLLIEDEYLWMTLESPFGIAKLGTKAEPVNHFVVRTLEEVGPEDEYDLLNIDKAIAQVLKRESA